MDKEIVKLIQAGFTMPQIEKMLFLRREQQEHIQEEKENEKKHQEFLQYLVKNGFLEP